MDIDYEAESVSAAPPLSMGVGMGRPFHIPREDRELNGDDEEGGLREEEVEEVEEVDLEEDHEDEEEEELEDKELIEEQELRNDGLGVEERTGMVQDDE